MKVRILGGGLSGLFSAYAFAKRGCEVEVFEKSEHWGGLVRTLHLPWGLVETAANGLLNSENIQILSADLNLPFLPMQKEYRRRYIYRGRPRQMPLSGLEAFRFGAGLLRRKPPTPGERLIDYADQVFGFGAARYLIEPGVLGVFGTTADELSAHLVYDYFFKYRTKSAGAPRGTVAPVQGMGALVDALVQWLENRGVNMHLACEGQIAPEDSHDLQIVATDATAAAQLLEGVLPHISQQLRHIRYLPLASITLGFCEPGTIKGFGCLFPRPEKFHSYGVLFNSYIFAERGPLYTETWIAPAVNEPSEEELLTNIQRDREKLFGKSVEPEHYRVQVWPRALPVYDLTLESVLRSLSLPPHIALMGNYLGRMGLSKILDQALELAKSRT